MSNLQGVGKLFRDYPRLEDLKSAMLYRAIKVRRVYQTPKDEDIDVIVTLCPLSGLGYCWLHDERFRFYFESRDDAHFFLNQALTPEEYETVQIYTLIEWIRLSEEYYKKSDWVKFSAAEASSSV